MKTQLKNSIITYTYLIISGILFPYLLLSQNKFEPASINYTIEDGLPSNETYCIHQDQQGYIWIGTDRGLCRYNGYEFETFTTSDGLTDNVIFNIYEDDWGRMWFRTYNHTLCYYHNGKFFEFKYNKVWLDFLNRFDYRNLISNIIIDKDSSLYISIEMEGFVKIDKEGNIGGDYLQLHRRDNSHPIVYFKEINNRPFVYGFYIIGQNVEDSDTLTIYVDYKNQKHIIKTLSVHRPVFSYNNIKAGIFSIGNMLIEVMDSITIHPPSKEAITDLYKSNKGLWSAHLSKGIKTPDNKRYLDNLSVTGIEKDKNNGFWFSTLENGIYYYPEFSVEQIEYIDEEFKNHTNSIVKDSSGIVYFGTKEGTLYQVLDDSIHVLSNSLPQQKLKYDKYTHSIFSYDQGQTKRFDLTKKKEIDLNLHGVINELIIKEDALLGIQKVMLFRILKNSSYKTTNAKGINANVFSSLVDTDSTIYLGTMDGLYKMTVDDSFSNIQVSQKIYPKNEDQVIRIQNIQIIDKKFWLSTIGHGVIIYDTASQTETMLNTKNGFISDNVNHVLKDSFENVWIATNNGISIVDKKTLKTVKTIDNENGLISNEVTQLLFNDGIIWAVTPKGITKVKLDQFLKTELQSPPPYIQTVDANDSTINSEKLIDLNYDQNNISINYLSISFNNKSINYKYRLLNQDSTWFITTSRTARFLSLSHGEYTFEVSSQNKDGIWSSPAQLHFVIHPAFWQTAWFLTLVVLVILLTISGVIVFRFRTIATRKELESSVERFRYRALTSQMNPHFVFNALNSIQYFILGQDRRAASKYLSTFAKLIRASFENSKLELIPLEDELDALRLYMDLENLRLENKVELSFEVDVKINLLDTRVPPLLIQPFVENAFLHGLAPKKEGEMKLSVELKDQPKYIYCKIEDNGIGREAAKELKKAKDLRRRKSSGMSMTEDRLDAFAQLQNLKDNSYKVEITDLFDGNKSPTGTIVELFIPKTFSTTN